MKKIPFFLMLCCFALSCGSFAEQSPLKLTITSEKNSYKKNENIMVLAKIENIQKDEICVATMPRWGQDIFINVAKVNKYGRFEQEVWELEKTHTILQKEYYHAIAKGESVKTSADLKRWVSVLEPGTYEVSVHYKIAPKTTKGLEGKIWTDRVDSNVINITIE